MSGGGGKDYRIAILYICIGEYRVFWEEFFDSSERYFLPLHKKEYFVFADSPPLYQGQNAQIHFYPQENLGWPLNTLKRFEMFLRAKDALQDFDFIFFFNANAVFIRPIGEEFLPLQEGLLVVEHPGFYNAKPDAFTYDRNPKSLAYIPCGEGEVYVCGGINGGKTKAYLAMIEELARRVEVDLANGVIALWHDESHLNAYIHQNKDYKLLDAGYCYPHWEIPFEKKIYLRNKEEYFDVWAFKCPSETKRIFKKLKSVWELWCGKF